MSKIILFVLFFLSSLLLLLFSPHLTSSTPNVSSPLAIERHFQQWMLNHGRNYSNLADQQRRLQIFADNYKLVDEHNKKNLSYRLKLNKFADLTDEEFTCNKKKLFIFYYCILKF